MEEQQRGPEEPGDWRKRFIALAEDVCRLRGQPAVAIVDDPDNYLSMEIPMEGQDFEILHFPEAPERLVVHCRMGAVASARRLDILKSSLAMNSHLARSHAGMFAVDPETDTLVYSTFQSLRELTAEQLVEELAAIPAVTVPWLQRFE